VVVEWLVATTCDVCMYCARDYTLEQGIPIPTSTELTCHRCPLGDSWQQSLRNIADIALSNASVSQKCEMQDHTCSDSRCSTQLGVMA